MNLTERFEVARPRDEVVELLCCDEALLELMSQGETEIVDRDGDRRTTETRYTALGREGIATFRFTFLMDGNIRFEKVCDGNVWKKLEGTVSVEEIDAGSCEIEIELSGKTRALVPEFTIKGPMEEQIRDMTRALEERLRG
jgi:carbon monoxide dehydrogenase subunit G